MIISQGRTVAITYTLTLDSGETVDSNVGGEPLTYTQGEEQLIFGLELALEGKQAGESLKVSVKVTNTGARAGDEVVQLYVRDVEALVPVPIRQLQGFTRVHLKPGAQQTVTFILTPRQMSLIADDGQRVVEPGVFEVAVGGGQPGTSAPGLIDSFKVVG